MCRGGDNSECLQRLIGPVSQLASMRQKKTHHGGTEAQRNPPFLRMENRKQETGDSEPVNASAGPFARFPFPVSGFLFFISPSSGSFPRPTGEPLVVHFQ